MKKLWLVLFLVPCLAGCGPSSSRGYMPEIPVPERPRLKEMEPEDVVAFKALPEGTQNKLVSNNEALLLYTTRLEIGVNGYNSFVKYNNALVDKALGIQKEEEKK